MSGKWPQSEFDSSMLEQIVYEIPDFPILCREWKLEDQDKGVLPWHWHSQVEFLYVEKGEITCLINTSSIVLKEREGIFINSKESHSILRNVGTGCIKSILLPAEFIFGTDNHFYKECIKPFAHQEQYQYICLTGEKIWQKDVLSQMEKLRAYCSHSLEKKLSAVIFSVCRIWEALSSNKEEIPVTDPSQVRSPSRIRLQQMLSFVRRYYSEPITLADIAGAANISQSGATRCFKRNLQREISSSSSI